MPDCNEMVFIGKDCVDTNIWAARFEPGCLRALPWDNEVFDCVIFDFRAVRVPVNWDEIAKEVVEANTDWVHTTGPEAELVHDIVDRTSVEVGRQQAIGDGDPMTAWHNDLLTIDQMAEFTIPFCGQDNVVVIVVGRDTEFKNAVSSLGNALRMPRNGDD